MGYCHFILIIFCKKCLIYIFILSLKPSPAERVIIGWGKKKLIIQETYSFSAPFRFYVDFLETDLGTVKVSGQKLHNHSK